MPQYHIWTIGCQMNKAESERLSTYLEKMDYQPVDAIQDADLVILNSCVVRQSAENRVINKVAAIRALKRLHPDIVLAVTGCLVGSDTEQLKKKYPYVDYFFKPGECLPWLDKTESWPAVPQNPLPATYITIMQGCNNFCSYCIVPYRRGRERSRPVGEVVCETIELVKRGVKEVTLLGQNVDSYGRDLPEKPDLADLLVELNGVEGLARIRFLTNHPKDMSMKLIQTVAALDKICEQINLPVQSGDNEILKAMRRGYTAEHYLKLISDMRREVPGIAISTDVIVGFPSESELRFQNTYDLLEEIKFDMVHVAAYSPREETLASREFEDNVADTEKKERLNKVEQLQERIAGEINAKLLDQVVEVLVEGKKKGKWYGRTRTDKLVFFPYQDDCVGSLMSVKVIHTSAWSLVGEVE